jgi:hypothetical protein
MCGEICESHGGTCLICLAIVRVETALDKGRETSLTVMWWRAAHTFFVGLAAALSRIETSPTHRSASRTRRGLQTKIEKMRTEASFDKASLEACKISVST